MFFVSYLCFRSNCQSIQNFAFRLLVRISFRTFFFTFLYDASTNKNKIYTIKRHNLHNFLTICCCQLFITCVTEHFSHVNVTNYQIYLLFFLLVALASILLICLKLFFAIEILFFMSCCCFRNNYWLK